MSTINVARVYPKKETQPPRDKQNKGVEVF